MHADERTQQELIESEARYRALFEHMTAGFVLFEVVLNADGVPVDLVVLASNAGFERTTGLRIAEVEGRRLTEVLPGIERDGAGWIGTYGRVALSGEPCEFEQHSDLLRRSFAVSAYSAGHLQVAVTFEDITARKQAEALLSAQAHVIAMIAEGATLLDALTELVRCVEAQAPEMLGSILLLDDDGTHVRHAASPSLPATFVAAIEGEPIGPRAGSCGTSAYRREPVYVEDIATDPLWTDYRAVALAHGLRACWSTPIFDAEHRVLGTFAMYYREPALPTAEHRALIALVTHTAALAIGRHQAAEVLRAKSTELDRYFNHSLDLLCIADTDGYFRRLNPEWERTLGYPVADLEGRQFMDFIHPDDVAATRDALAQLSAQHEVLNFLNRYRHRDGTYRWVEWRSYAEGGQIFAVARDVTEHLVTERAMRDQLEELRRWQAVTLDREDRVLTLKAEVNALLAARGEPPRYESPEA